MKSLNKLFLSAGDLVLLEHNVTALRDIYINVLKHGYSIDIERVDHNGSYSFRMARQNPNWNNYTEDWQFHELPFIQTSFAVLHPVGSNK